MSADSCFTPFFAALMVLTSVAGCSAAPTLADNAGPVRVTILYDAFGDNPAMQRDWGYAALVEFGGKRILFDSGNNPDVLAQNAKAKAIDLSTVDFVVMCTAMAITWAD